MLDETTKNAVADYVLDPHDRERLKLAVTIRDAFDTVRLRVVKDFSKQISRCLLDRLPEGEGWSLAAEDLLERPEQKLTGLWIRRATWDEGLYVGIESQTAGPGSWIIGVSREEGYQNSALMLRLIEKCGPGRDSPPWLWYHRLSDGAEFGHWEWGDWTSGASIMAMHDGAAGDYGKRLCGRIVDIARAVDGVFGTLPAD